MEETKKELLNKLEQIAFNKTTAFCYSCYKQVKQSHCPQCFSDDLMRELQGVGVEYGTGWVITSILEEELISLDDNTYYHKQDIEEFINQQEVA